MLQMQVHNKNGAIQLCHTSCVSEYLARLVLDPSLYTSIAPVQRWPFGGYSYHRSAIFIVSHHFVLTPFRKSNPGLMPTQRMVRAPCSYPVTLSLIYVDPVVSLLIVNIDNFPASAFDTIFVAAGLNTISYAPPTAVVAAPDWPTLGSMIDSGKRLVTFLDNGADFTAVPYLIDGNSHNVLYFAKH